ncbi:MAG: ABC transporter permease [Caldilineaceae bacterium]|nr:ABC transporter permease [Caldilineaceae bacterium]
MSHSSQLQTDALPKRERSRWLWLNALLRRAPAVAALVVITVIVLAGILAPLVAPYDPNAQEYGFMEAPSVTHWLGTDDLGRDLFSRIVYGARISLFVGVVTVLLSMILGVLLGLLAGYYGGWVDNVIMRYIDLQWAFPNFIIAVYLVAVFGTGLSNVIVAVTLAFLDDFARIVRGMVLSLRTQEFVIASRATGARDLRIMLRHILPNAAAPIIVQATVSISAAILAEAGLSFLGLGVKPSTPTWGLILSDARSFFSRAWWMAVFPGLAITLTVLSINFLGDALRDIFDVREYAD